MNDATTYDVRIYRTEVYKGVKVTTYRVRWKAGNREWRQGFRTAAQADSFRSALLTAARRGEAFSLATGRPTVWAREKAETTWYEFACRYVDMKWKQASAKYRKDIARALTAATPERPAMRRAIADLANVLVVVLVSKYLTPTFVSTGQVFAHKLAVFPYDRSAYLALLSSSPNQQWAILRCSTLETRLNYSPSDAFDTLPQPSLTDKMEQAGQHLDAFRRSVMEVRKVGLTHLYNLVHAETVGYDDILQLRQIHVGIDQAVLEAYALDERAGP